MNLAKQEMNCIQLRGRMLEKKALHSKQEEKAEKCDHSFHDKGQFQRQ